MRVSTKGFEASLDSMLRRLSKKMESAGTSMGKDFERGLQKADVGKSLSTSIDKHVTKSTGSLRRLDGELNKVAATGKRAFDSVGSAAADAATSMNIASGDAKEFASSMSDVDSSSSRASRSLRGLGGGGGGGGGSGLRAAAGDADFFSSKMRDLVNFAPSGVKILATLHDTAAFAGSGLTALVGSLSAAAQGIFTVGANAAAAAPALSIFSAGIIGLAQTGGVLAIAMQGVGSALQSGFKALQPTTAATNSLGNAAASAARAVRDAKQNLADAYQAAARAASDAARRTLEAERALADSQQILIDSQNALNDARAEGLQQLKEIGFAAEQAGLNEQQAALALQDARQQLIATSELPPDDRARVEAELAFKQAELNYREAKNSRQRADKDQRDAAKKGLQGTDALIKAHQDVADAQQGVNDKTRDLAAARLDEARTAEDNARRIADALQAVKDAQNQVTQATNQGATATDAYTQALKNLSPQQRKFVTSLVDLHDNWVKARGEIADPLFKGLNESLDTLLKGKLLGQVKTQLEGTSGVLGDLTVKATNMAESGPFRKAFSDTLKSNNKVLGNFGTGAIDLADAFVQLADAAGPLLRRFSNWFKTVADGIDDQARLKNRTGELSDTINTAGDRVSEFWNLAKQLWRTLKTLGSAANDAANGFSFIDREGRKSKGFIPSLTDSMKTFNDKLEKNPDLVKNFTNALKNLKSVGRLLKQVVDPLIMLGSDPRLGQMLDKISKSKAFDQIAKSAGDALPAFSDIVVNVLDFVGAISKSNSIENFLAIMAKLSGVLADVAKWLGDTGVLKWVGLVTGGLAAMRLAWLGVKIIASPFITMGKGATSLYKSIGNITTQFTNLFRKTGQKKELPFPKPDAKTEGKKVTDTYAEGIRAGLPEKDAAMQALKANVLEQFAKMRPALVEEANIVGVAIVTGLVTGIEEATAEATIAANRAGRTTADAVGKGAQTKSPSRLTMPVGRDLMTGLTVGIEEGQAGAVLAAEEAGLATGTAVGTGAETSAAASSGKFAGIFGKFGKFAGPASKLMKPLSLGIRGIGAAFRFAMGPIGLIVLTLLPILWPLLVKLEEKTGIFSKTFRALGDAFKWVWDKIKDLFNWVKKNWPILLGILLGPFGLAVVLIIKHWDKILDFIKAIPGKVKDFLKGMWEFIQIGLDWLWDHITAIWGKVFDFIKGVPGRVFNALRTVWNVVTDKLRDAWDAVKRIWGNVVDWVKGRPRQFVQNLKKLWEIFKTGLQWYWNSVKNFWSTVVTWIKGRPAQFKENLSKLWDILKTGLQDAWGWIQNKWNDIKTAISNWPNAIGNALGGLWDKFKDSFVSAYNAVAGFINDKLIGGINSILDKLHIPKLPDTLKMAVIPLAEGGPVHGPGGPKSDRILAALSNGEYVMPTRAAQRIGPKNLDYMRKFGEVPPQGGLFGFVTDKFGSLVSAIKDGATTAIKWLLGHLSDGIGGDDNFIFGFMKGVLKTIAGGATDWGQRQDLKGTSPAGFVMRGPAGAWGLPVTGSYYISQYPNSGHSPSWAVDMAGNNGQRVLAASAGRVIEAGFSTTTGYGNTVLIQHTDGQLSRYAHMLKTPYVKAGQNIRRGAVLGIVDSTGHATGPHLHFELYPPTGSTIANMLRHGIRLGEGGVVAPSAGGTLAMIAEKGHHERVTPLDSEGFTPAERRMLDALESSLGTGGGDTYNVHPSAGMNEAAIADMVLRRVAWKRRRGSGARR